MTPDVTKVDSRTRMSSTTKADSLGSVKDGGREDVELPTTGSCSVHSIRLFVLFAGFVMCAQAALAIYTKSVLTSIEKQFEISSSLAGFIVGSFNIGNLLFVVAVSKLSSKRHRPRIMGLGSLLIAVGGFVNAVPHLLNAPYRPTSNSTSEAGYVCDSELEGSGANTSSADNSHLYLVLILGEILQGIGTTVHIPISSSYIDDFASASNSPIYLGISFVFQNIGPGIGYLIGAFTSNLYVDFDRVSADTVTITTKDRSWIGAWWLGYLLIGAWVLVAALPLFLFPKSMKKEEVCKECVDGGASDIAKPLTNGAIDVHWKNSSAGAVVKVDNVSKKANLTEKSSNCSLLLMSDKKEDQRETPRVGFCQDFFDTIRRLVTNPVYLLIVLGYSGLMFVVGALTAFMPKFLQEVFRKSASSANLTFGLAIPPVLCAGLLSGGFIAKRLKWTERQMLKFVVICAAVALLPIGASFLFSCNTPKDGCSYPLHNRTAGTSSPLHGCSSDCDAVAIGFVVVVSLAAFIASNMVTPIYTVVLRLVAPEDKCTGIGLMFLIMRVLGLVPAPIISGAVIDSTCVEWKVECGDNKNCTGYDTNRFKNGYLTIVFVAIFYSFLLNLFAYLLLARKHSSERSRLCSFVARCKRFLCGDASRTRAGSGLETPTTAV